MSAPNIFCGSLKLVPGERTYIMGIVNTTPDSFSDGGLYYSTSKAIDHGLKLIDQGADILDIGGVSTAPTSRGPVELEEELKRVVPVISGLAQHGIRALSVDTSHAVVAQRALEHGASWINDQEAGRGENMPQVLAQAQGCVLMHRRGQSGVQAGENYTYKNIQQEISDFFEERLACLALWGLKRECVVLDPGVGFGKGLADSLSIINNMANYNQGALTMLGVSRKSFLERLTCITEAAKRDDAGLGAMAAGIMSGAHILRVHNVKAAYDMTRVLDACLKARVEHEDLYQTR
jgi:dihydropteroate synthase